MSEGHLTEDFVLAGWVSGLLRVRKSRRRGGRHEPTEPQGSRDGVAVGIRHQVTCQRLHSQGREDTLLSPNCILGIIQPPSMAQPQAAGACRPCWMLYSPSQDEHPSAGVYIQENIEILCIYCSKQQDWEELKVPEIIWRA